MAADVIILVDSTVDGFDAPAVVADGVIELDKTVAVVFAVVIAVVEEVVLVLVDVELDELVPVVVVVIELVEVELVVGQSPSPGPQSGRSACPGHGAPFGCGGRNIWIRLSGPRSQLAEHRLTV